MMCCAVPTKRMYTPEKGLSTQQRWANPNTDLNLNPEYGASPRIILNPITFESLASFRVHTFFWRRLYNPLYDILYKGL